MSDHIGDTHEMVKGYVEEARVTRTEEIRGRVEKAIPEFIVPDDVKYLLTALQKVEADRNRYIQRAGSAEGRLEVMEADLQALREENARLKVKSDALDRAHALLDRLDVPPAQGRVCDDPNCETHIEHRIHMLSDRAAALSSSPARESDHAGL